MNAILKPKRIARSAVSTFKPLTLWFLDHETNRDELIFQVREMKRQGMGGFYMHWINGGEPYMSEGWFDTLDIVIEEASHQGLEAWLYDEAWCPSCYAGGRILTRRPDLQLQSLWYDMIVAKGGETLSYDFDLMDVLGVYALPLENGIPQMDKMVNLDNHLGTVIEENGPAYIHDYGYYPHVPAKKHWRLDFGKNVWRLKWTAPAGQWQVYVFCARHMLQHEQFNRLDVLHPDSIKEFLSETHEVYKSRYNDYFGNVIPGVMTDEAKFWFMPWSDIILDSFEKRYSASLLEQLPALVDRRIPQHRLTRPMYYKLASDLFRMNYIKPMADWCSDNNLLLTGHISPEECPYQEVALTGSIAECIKYFDFPGTDLIIQAVGDEKRKGLNLGPRLAASVAHQQDKIRSFVEVGGCCTESLSIKELKYLCDWLMVNGINHINFHGLSYSLDGYRKFLTDQTLSVYNNLWPEFNLLSEYLEERCELLTEFRANPRIGVLKPLTAARLLQEKDEQDHDEGMAVDRSLIDSCWQLLTHQLDFDLVDEDSYENWSVENGELNVYHAKYKALIIPDCHYLPDYIIEHLNMFSGQGGLLLCVDYPPDILDLSHSSASWQHNVVVCDCNSLTDKLQEAISRDYSIDGDNRDKLFAYPAYNTKGEFILFLLNSADSENAFTVECTYGKQDITLQSHETIVIDKAYFEKSARQPVENEISLDGPWSVHAEEANHVPITQSSTELVIQGTVEGLSIVFDQSEYDIIAKSLRINGKAVDLAGVVKQTFYDSHNYVLGLDDLQQGTHHIEVDTYRHPTVLIAGRFAAFMKSAGRIELRDEADEAESISRIHTGYPFLRGYLRFMKTFEIDRDTDCPIQLILPDLLGSATIYIDGASCGTTAWKPYTISGPQLKSGSHQIEIRLLGDSLGIMRGDPCEAGISSSPRLLF